MSKKQPGSVSEFTPRSAASLRRQAGLREQLANVEEQVKRAKKTLSEQETARDRLQANIRRTGGTTGYTMQGLDNCLLEIKKLNLRLESLSQMQAELDANIEAECVIPEDRAGVQAAFATVALRRLDFDGRIEKQLDELRAAIAKRAEFTRELEGLAERIEFTGSLDGDRYADTLAGINPHLPGAERWYAQTVGREVAGLVRAVARMAFELPETLHHSGLAQPGDELLLTEAEFAELSQSHYALKLGDSCFAGEQKKYFTARRVVSAEQAERDRAAAANAGRSITDYWESEDEFEFQGAEKARTHDYGGRLWDKRVEDLMESDSISRERAERRVEIQYGPRP
jgi:hypothetical protein